MARLIQFRGKEKVLDAFDKMNVPAWALFTDKELFTKGIGEEMLIECLDLLSQGDSLPLYRLKVYEGITDASQIKDKTPCDGSFTFSFNEDQNYDGPYGETNRKNKLFQRLEALEDKVINGAEPEGEKETLGSVAMGLLKEPAQLAQMIDIGRALLGLPPMYQQQTYPATLPANTIGNINAVDNGERIGKALMILEQNDPKLVIHLEKLAAMSEKNKTGFQSLLSMLDMM